MIFSVDYLKKINRS